MAGPWPGAGYVKSNPLRRSCVVSTGLQVPREVLMCPAAGTLMADGSSIKKGADNEIKIGVDSANILLGKLFDVGDHIRMGLEQMYRITAQPTTVSHGTGKFMPRHR